MFLNAHRELLVSINLLLFYFDFLKEAGQLLNWTTLLVTL